MDIFSFLPIIIFIYAIATIFNPGNKTPNNRRQSPFPSPQTWREKIEELERELFTKAEDRKQPTWRSEQTVRTGRIEEKPDWARTRPYEDPTSEGFGSEGYSGIEGSGTEGLSGIEGSTGTEGAWGSEGTSGTEGTFGSEGTYGSEGNFGRKKSAISKGIPNREFLSSGPKEERSGKPKQQENPTCFPRLTEGALMQGVIWAEVLGKPRARSGWSYSRRR